MGSTHAWLHSLVNSTLLMATLTLVVGQWHCPVTLSESRAVASAPTLFGSFIWFPALLYLLDRFQVILCLDSGYGFVVFLIGLQWWLQGMAHYISSLWFVLDPPPPWPDPPSLIPFGYARRWCKHIFPRHHRRFGRYETHHMMDFAPGISFTWSVTYCWFALWSCVAGVILDKFCVWISPDSRADVSVSALSLVTDEAGSHVDDEEQASPPKTYTCWFR